MNRKYELLKDGYIQYSGHARYRILALRDVGDVKRSQLGGCKLMIGALS